MPAGKPASMIAAQVSVCLSLPSGWGQSRLFGSCKHTGRPFTVIGAGKHSGEQGQGYMGHVPFTLDKWIWSDADFDQMGWHATWVHAFAAIPETYEVIFDIDYILRWMPPVPPKDNYAFWVAPATLVFENVWNVEVQ